ncbi:MAG: cysteine--tRNA ligase [Oscillospiraceae bacterium]|jgi:cysteinyl-tRNA synthetase|nr:cysteine--tRNA ligase [Oscillospiraceae bacterium]
MKLYNTLTRKKEIFKPINKNKVKIYSCGPTVYNYIHLGNARPVCVFDVLRRYLEYCGFSVLFVQNFTDIDDKIIKESKKMNISVKEVSDLYRKEYEKDAKGLLVKKADIHPTATAEIKNIIIFISELINLGFAYKTDSGDIYFNINKFSKYGKLSGQSLKDLQLGSRHFLSSSEKINYDFVLWKIAKEDEPFWDSPWGKGRPGWHIECSSMIRTYLGTTIDIHCGGQDLCFPHHENEIAQSESCNNKKLANFWLHNGFVNINNEKMSKSLGNFFTVRDVANKFGYSVVRYLMLSSHYRTPINYSEEIMNQCNSALLRIKNCQESLICAIKLSKIDITNEIDNNLKEDLLKHKICFIEAMDDDLNTANALAALFNLIRDVNSKVLSKNSNKETLVFCKDLICELTSILGFLNEERSKNNSNDEIEYLLFKREEARKNKDFKEADKIREELDKKNVIVKDTNKGYFWKFKD